MKTTKNLVKPCCAWHGFRGLTRLSLFSFPFFPKIITKSLITCHFLWLNHCKSVEWRVISTPPACHFWSLTATRRLQALYPPGSGPLPAAFRLVWSRLPTGLEPPKESFPTWEYFVHAVWTNITRHVLSKTRHVLSGFRKVTRSDKSEGYLSLIFLLTISVLTPKSDKW